MCLIASKQNSRKINIKIKGKTVWNSYALAAFAAFGVFAGFVSAVASASGFVSGSGVASGVGVGASGDWFRFSFEGFNELCFR